MSGLGIPQTDYSIDYQSALPGMIAEPGNPGNYFESTFVANELIQPGQLVEYLSPGVCRLPQGTTNTMNLLGVAVYRASKTATLVNSANGQAAYNVGDQVTIMKRGKIYASFTGTTVPVQTAAIQVQHASDNTASNAQYRGKVTDAAASTVAGSEATAVPAGVRSLRAPMNGTGLALLELNMP